MAIPQADVAVDIEVFVYAVAAVAVFAVAVAAVAVVEMNEQLLSRFDLQAIANELSVQLADRALEVRDSGVLRDFKERNIGFTR